MKPEKPAVPESLLAMWVFIGFAATAFVGYLGARGDGLDWYVSLPLPPGAIPAWAFGPATVLVAGVATLIVVKAREPGERPRMEVLVLTWTALCFYSAAELLLFGAHHGWVSSTICFGIAALFSLVVSLVCIGRFKLAAGLMTLLAIWFAWVGIGTYRSYKIDKDTVPSATVTDVGISSHPPPPSRSK